MKALDRLKRNLKQGKVYRRGELAQWSTSVDRHVAQLVKDGTLVKMSTGMYAYPKKSAFGNTPPDENELVKGYLKNDNFLVTSPNHYNSLGLGTTQLYNKAVVYNTKRHGDVKLGNRVYHFVTKGNFPKQMSKEFLLVDLLNNVNSLAEDHQLLLEKLKGKLSTFDRNKLRYAVSHYANKNTKHILISLLKFPVQ